MDIYVLLVFLMTLIGSWLLLYARRPPSFPPGPKGWPIIGNLGYLVTRDGQLHVTFRELSRKFGSIVGLMMGNRPVIILSSYQAIKDALADKSDVFSGRNVLPYFPPNILGLVDSNGPFWRESRRFALKSLRDLGYAKQFMEDKISEEVQLLCTEMENSCEQLIGSATGLIHQATFNVIYHFCFGHRFEYDMPALIKLLKENEDILTSPCQRAFICFVPILKMLPLNAWHLRIEQISEDYARKIAKITEAHVETYDPLNHRDMVDKKIKRGEEPDPLNISSTENFTEMVTDLLHGGADTTANTVCWALLYLIRHPDIQERCHQEIDNVVGAGRQPCLADRKQMPYVNATIHETLRLAPALPLTIPHRTTGEARLHGYVIPKDTVVFVNLYAAHTDPSHWERPETFSPGRWLDEEGKLCQHKAFIPFSLGSRSCLGETMARDEVFLLLTNVLQRFCFSPEDADQPPPLAGHYGVTSCPLPFKVLVTAR